MGLRPQPANEFALIRTSIWMFPKIVGFPPKSSILIGPGFPVFHYKPSILGVVPLFLETPIFLPGVVFNHPVDPHQGDWASEVQLCPSEASQRTKGYRDAGGTSEENKEGKKSILKKCLYPIMTPCSIPREVNRFISNRGNPKGIPPVT